MELLNKLRVSRRFALRGALGGIGVAMWLPVLDAMCNNNGTAFAQGEALPTSFGIWFWGNGIHTDVWTPKAAGSGDAWQLPTNLQDFAEVKDAMTLVTGLDMLDAKFKGHGWGVAYVLAGGDGNLCSLTSDIDRGGNQFETSRQTQYQPTVDQTIADALHTNEPFKSYETGMIPFTGDVAMGTVGSNLAHRGPSNFLAPRRDPKAIFDELFSAVAPPAPGGGGSGAGGSAGVPSDISFKTRRSVLDAVMQDANRLKMTLGAEDSKRIDAHMDGIRELENRIPNANGTGGAGGTGSTGTMCTPPEAPPVTLADITAKSQTINRLLVAALSCNLTRVYSHMWSGPRSDSSYPVIQLNGAHHAYTHGDDGQEPRKIERYIMSQYADLAKVMKATPMGAGTVLDKTLIYGVSEVAEPHDHVMKNYHMVLMGHGGGKLPGNRHVRLPGRKVTELVLTLQQIMGLNVESWGSWDRTSKTMPELWT
ncbi:MAG: hypothetical protein K0R38_1455 [Polyangiaceae bacterium]|jgi:hypothetical protein|nr:hypothetical protein [Polyangiaceae bacterium]